MSGGVAAPSGTPALILALTIALLLATGGSPPAIPGAAAAEPDRAGLAAERREGPAGREIRRWRPRTEIARRYARRRAGGVRFAIVAPSGTVAGLRAGSTVEAASVIKAMLLVTYLRVHRDERLTNSAKRRLGAMIRRSDNEAAYAIRDSVGMRAVDRLARRARMRHFRQSSSMGLSRIAAGDMARFMFRLDRYLPERHERYAKRLLSDIVGWQRWGAADARPKGWRLMFKSGWGVGPGRVENQVARLERGRHRIGLAVLTDYGPSKQYKRETIEGITERLLRRLPR